MKKSGALLWAALIVVTLCGPSWAASMDSISWGTAYDTFPVSPVSPGLWTVDMKNVGLSFSDLGLGITASSDSYLYLNTTRKYGTTDYFAAKIAFQVSSASAGSTTPGILGLGVHTGSGLDKKAFFIYWFWGSYGPITGPLFVSGPADDKGPIGLPSMSGPTSATPSGELGYIFDGPAHMISTYYREGTGPWQSLYNGPIDWTTGQVNISLDTSIQGTGSLHATVREAHFTSVPVPSAFLLLGPGLIGIAAIRRRLRK